MKYLAKLSGVAFLAMWLTIGPICAAYAVTIQAATITCTWIMPNGHDDWEPGYAGQTIQVKFETIGSDSSVYYESATVDYETATSNCFIDITGLTGNFHWGVTVSIPTQLISDGNGNSALIGEDEINYAFRDSHGYTHTVMLGPIKLNGSYGL